MHNPKEVLFFFGCTYGMWNFLGWGWNPGYSSNLSHCNVNTESLNCCTTRELLKFLKESVTSISRYRLVIPILTEIQK